MNVVAIDGNSMLFRAFFAFSRSGLTNYEGIETGAIHGFVNMLTTVIEGYSPDQVVVAFDLPEDTFRHALIQDYKGGRPETPESLIVQLLLVKQFLELLEIPIFELPGFEADDILATVSELVKLKNGETILVSGDRDIFQLVEDPSVRLLYPIKGLSQTSLFNEKAIYDKTGVWPRDYPLYATLRGDPSDNLPGVRKVGEKTAALLTNEYGSLDAIYNNLDKLKPAIAESFAEAKERIYQILEIVHLKRDLNIDLDFESKFRDLRNINELEEYFAKLQIVQSWVRLKNVLGRHSTDFVSGRAVNFSTGSNKVAEVSDIDGGSIRYIENVEQNSVLNVAIKSNEVIEPRAGRIDVMANSLRLELNLKQFSKLTPDKMLNISGAPEGNDEPEAAKCFMVVQSYLGAPGRSKLKWFALCEIGAFVKDRIIETDEQANLQYCVIYPEQYDLSTLQKVFDLMSKSLLIGAGLKEFVRSLNMIAICTPKSFFDFSIASFLVDPNLNRLDIPSVVNYLSNYLSADFDYSEAISMGRAEKLKNSKQNDLLSQSEDVDLASDSTDTMHESGIKNLPEQYSFQIKAYNLLNRRLSELHELELFENIEMPVLDCLTEMELLGIQVDRSKLKEMIQNLELTRSTILQLIYETVGHEFNVGSPKQLSGVLYDEIGLQSQRETKTGRSTDANTLAKLKGLHPVIDMVLEYREVDKLLNTYGTSLLNCIDSDSRIHASFSLTSTRTGRISSESPNLHNIPVRTELGQKFREVFIAKPEYSFVIADYDQIELRLLAYYSKDLNLLNAFIQGSDIHKFVASVVYGVPVDKVDKSQRSVAKMVSYGLVYGMEAFGLSERLNISVGEAKVILNKYFESFPGLRIFIDGSIEQIKINRYISTILGRRRYFEDLNKLNRIQRLAIERQATNSIIQGSAADLFKLAINRVNSGLKAGNVDSSIVLQVHDELIIESPIAKIDIVKNIVKENMEGVAELGIPLKVHIGSGSSWANK